MKEPFGVHLRDVWSSRQHGFMFVVILLWLKQFSLVADVKVAILFYVSLSHGLKKLDAGLADV